MSKTAIYDYSTATASNTDLDGLDSTGATGLVKSGDNYTRSLMSHAKGFALDLGAVNTVGGTADAITVTLASAPSALVDGMRFTFNASAANTGATTLNVTPAGGSAFGAKKVMKWEAGSEAELGANDIPAANALIEVIYDSARNASAGAWMKIGSSVAAATTSAAGIVELATNAETLAGSSSSLAVTPAGLSPLYSNVLLNSIKIADLEGTRLNMAGGIADAYDSETDVDTATSTNESYDATNDLYSPTATSVSLITTSGLTTIGDFDTRLTAFTDGTTSQGNAAASGKIAAGNTANAYVGKDLATAKSIDNVVVYPSNDSGSAGGGITTLTINLRGSNSSPASRSDGTLLGTTGAFSDDTATRTITSTDATAFRYVWLEYIASSGSDQWFLAEWQLYERGTTNNMTLVSNAFTASAVPTQARVAVFIDPQVSITINTDFTAEVSRDGGTTWTAVTLAIVSNPVGTVEQYEGTVSISAQPSGTSMKYRLKTLNNKDIDVTGIVFQWS